MKSSVEGQSSEVRVGWRSLKIEGSIWSMSSWISAGAGYEWTNEKKKKAKNKNKNKNKKVSAKVKEFLIAVCNKDGDATILGRNQKFENPLLCAL